MGTGAKIICVGNRYAPEDALGPRVYDHLRRGELPPGVVALDGGLAGVNLLGAVEGVERVVFVDALTGFGRPREVVVLTDPDASVPARALGHGSGLGYLLRALPVACEPPPPSWAVVGAEGTPDAALVSEVAARALELALEAP